MNAWTSVLVAFMDSERTTGLSWRSWLYPEQQTAMTWAASDSSRSMTTPRSRVVSEMATRVPSTRTSWQSTLSNSWLEPSHSNCVFAAFSRSLHALSQALMSAIHAANLMSADLADFGHDYRSVNLQHPGAYLLVRNKNLLDSWVPA